MRLCSSIIALAISGCWFSPLRQARHAHAVIDPELQRLHALAHFGIVTLPMLGVGVVGLTAHPRERVIDVAAAVVGH